MTEKAIYLHHERTTDTALISDLQSRELGFSSENNYAIYKTNGGISKYILTMSTKAMTESSGNICIGDRTPTTQLDIYHATNDVACTIASGKGVEGRVYNVYTNAAGSWSIGQEQDYFIISDTDNLLPASKRFQISPTGLVNIPGAFSVNQTIIGGSIGSGRTPTTDLDMYAPHADLVSTFASNNPNGQAYSVYTNDADSYSIGINASDNYVIAHSADLSSPVLTIDTSQIATFANFPITPSSAPTADYQVANKKYVDDTNAAQDLYFAGDSGTGAVLLDSQTFTVTGGTNITSVAGSQTVTINLDDNVDLAGTLDVTGITTLDDDLVMAAGKSITMNNIVISEASDVVTVDLICPSTFRFDNPDGRLVFGVYDSGPTTLSNSTDKDGAVIWGDVGICNPSPEERLDVADCGFEPVIQISEYNSNKFSHSRFSFRKSRTVTPFALAETVDDENYGSIRWSGVNSSLAWAYAGGIIMSQDGGAGATYLPSRIVFNVGTDSAAPAEAMRLNSAGLTVNGSTTINAGAEDDALLLESADGNVWLELRDSVASSQDVLLIGIGDELSIHTGNSESVRVDTSGGVEMTKAKITPEGGFAMKLTNRSGAAMTKGQLVEADSANDDSFTISAAGANDAIGVVYDASIADDAEGWIVWGGIADVALEEDVSAVQGYWMGTSDSEAGYARTQASPPAVVGDHFDEIGHCLEAVTNPGGGSFILARCALHFL